MVEVWCFKGIPYRAAENKSGVLYSHKMLLTSILTYQYRWIKKAVLKYVILDSSPGYFRKWERLTNYHDWKKIAVRICMNLPVSLQIYK